MELGGELELTSCTHGIQLQLAFFYEALVIAPPANSVFEMGVQDLHSYNSTVTRKRTWDMSHDVRVRGEPTICNENTPPGYASERHTLMTEFGCEWIKEWMWSTMSSMAGRESSRTDRAILYFLEHTPCSGNMMLQYFRWYRVQSRCPLQSG